MGKHPTIDNIRWKAIESIIQEEGKGGLIKEYLYFKMFDPQAKYKEPTRKGTPKGEKIGFPSKKYFASILVGITNRKVKDIAQQSDVSYGLLRKWKTESDFKALAENHCSEFVDIIIQQISNQLKNQSEAIKDFYEGNGADPLERGRDSPLNASERVMIDAPCFNGNVLVKLEEAIKLLGENIKDREGDNHLYYFGLIRSIFNVISYAKLKLLAPGHPLITKQLISEVRKIVSAKRPPTGKERKIAIHALMTIENELDTLYGFYEKGVF
jgi:hypothetical protein